MNRKPTDNKPPADTKKTDTRMRQESSYPSGILNQLFTRTLGFQTLGSQALSRSWWQRWVYPVLFLLTLTLSLATYLTLDSVQQSVDRYINDNQRALV
ncbi:MAG: ABC transporter substrate-binding protein, partial [Psychrobacter sp.]|nr:ABC transporter substrate-binding protein [Psychrobacter sp.]